MLNVIVLNGRLTKDPVVKNLDNDKVVASFTLAVQRNKDEADFIPVEVWGKTAESIRDYVTKGSLIGVEGTLRVSSWENENGEMRTFTKVLGNRVHFIDLKTTTTGPSPEDFA